MTFACITPALIVGAFAERVKFWPLIIFVVLWLTLVYFPIAHMVWYWAGPDFLPNAPGDYGKLWGWGALDFAGGTVVHINAGIAGLVGCLVIGPRLGFKTGADAAALADDDYDRRVACCGSAGSASTPARTSRQTVSPRWPSSTPSSPPRRPALAWALIEQIVHKKAVAARRGNRRGRRPRRDHSGLGLRRAGNVDPARRVASIVCFFFVTTVKNKLRLRRLAGRVRRPLHRRHRRRDRHRRSSPTRRSGGRASSTTR